MSIVTELEQQLEAARVAEQARQHADWMKAQERQQQQRVREAEPRIRKLREKVDRVLAARPPASRPAPETRALARKFLHEGLIVLMAPGRNEAEALSIGDPRFGELFGLNREAGQQMKAGGGVGDEALTAELDAIECDTWRAVVQWAQVLAGEVAS
ncbi:MAG TPA: hypothetical protein VGA47_00290 [Candidatus Dormibacteraeota bacterium]